MSNQIDGILELLESIASGVIAENAPIVDRDGSFPEASIEALRRAGLLGLISATTHGGRGGGLREAAAVVERIARECGSTAMVLCMHYCGTAVIEKHGEDDTRQAIGRGEHLTTVAFSESGSRSHFWSPGGTAARRGEVVQLDAAKSWVTAATRADTYVWSSRPLAADGMSTIWLVPRSASGLAVGTAKFDGMGLRGNDSRPVMATGVAVPISSMLGEDGAGLQVMLNDVLPVFNVLTAAFSIGLMEGVLSRTIAHVSTTRHDDTETALADLPTIRSYIARMSIRSTAARTLWLDTIEALSAGRDDALLRVLQCKAASSEASTEVLGTAMRVCGGAAFRKEVGVERYYRDGAAQGVMSPTTDLLYDFIGKALCGLPVF